MRIVSNFKDYYDSIARYDSERDRIWIRKREVLKEPLIPLPEEFVRTKSYSLSGRSSGFLEIRPVAVLLCGILYRGATTEIGIKRETFWDLDSLKKYVGKLEFSGGKPKLPTEKTRWYFHKPWIIDDDWFRSDESFRGISIEKKIPLVVIEQDTRTLRGRKILFVKDDELKHLDFYRRMDAASIYQELAMFIDGIIGSSPPRMEKVSDLTLRDKHGFDEKSFKKEKQKR